MKNKIIQLKNISFVYDGDKVPIWQGLDCYFEKNKINLLLGPSGCGKSTLLYLLNGLIPDSIEGKVSGELLFNGENILKNNATRTSNPIGLVFQDPEIQFCSFTVEDELAFGLENACVPEDEIHALIDQALDMVGMKDYRKSLLSELSGGQKQKIAIASILIMKSEVLVLDEPTANLDASSRKEIFELIHELVENHNKTIILVEHNLDDLIGIAGNIVVLDKDGHLCKQANSFEMISDLVFAPKYQDIKVFLPRHLLAIREWTATSKDNKKVQDFCQKQINQIKKDQKQFSFPYEEFARLISPYIKKKDRSEDSAIINRKEKIICLDNVSFDYKNSTKKQKKQSLINEEKSGVLKNISMEIEEGDFVAIVGPNGVGKSTLLNIIFKVFKQYKGDISIYGKNLKGITKQKLYQMLGLVFQNPEWQFVTNLVYQELMFSLKKAKLSEEEKKDRVNQMLERFDLMDHKDKSPFLLSQGQKRRLSVATMLLTGQKILFLDEPTYGQDYENQIELMNIIKELNNEGVTIIMVTHDMSLVAEYANKVIVLSDGQVAYQGAIQGLFNNNDLLIKGRLQTPVIMDFCKEIKRYLAEMPIFYSKEKLTKYLIDISKEEV